MEGGGAASIFILLSLCFNFTDAEDDDGNNGALTPTNKNTRAAAEQQRVQIREQDVIRNMRQILPAHARISDDAKETVRECVSEYISFIVREANQRCQHEQRQTMTAEDLLWAIRRLGFEDYVDPLSVFLARYRGFDGNNNNNGLLH